MSPTMPPCKRGALAPFFCIAILLLLSNDAFAQNRHFLTFYGSDPRVTGGVSAGHAFVSFIREDEARQMTVIDGVWGLYPTKTSGAVTSFFIGEVPGEIRNDFGIQRAEGLTLIVCERDYKAALEVKKRWEKATYQLTKKDCVTFATEVARVLEHRLNIPERNIYDLPIAFIRRLKETNLDENMRPLGAGECSLNTPPSNPQPPDPPDPPKPKPPKPTYKQYTLFLFDLSGSMNDYGSGTIPKVEQAKRASQETLNALRLNGQGVSNQVAVLGFSGGCVDDPTVEISPFSTDLNAVERRIATMRAGGGTPLDKAIQASECKMAVHLRNEGQTRGKLIILSDGQGTCGSIRPPGVYNSAPLQRNRWRYVDAGQCGLAGSRPVAVNYYTVGFNIPPGSPAERDLQYLSQTSGGKYLNVQNQVQLARAFRKFNRVYQPKENPALGGLPGASVAEFAKGVTEIKDEYFSEALTRYAAFAQAHPTDCHGAYNLALSQEANDLYREAIDNYQTYQRLCPGQADAAFVNQQIAFLEEEFREFVKFQREVVRSDLEFLQLHFQRIQNGQSVALAEEFKGFLQEKGDYYERLPRLLYSKSKILRRLADDIASSLDRCASLIKRNPQTWDRDAVPIISMTYLNLEELLAEM